MTEVRSHLARLRRGCRRLLGRPWFRLSAWVAGLATASLATMVLLSAYAARGMADLEPWHRDAPDGEFDRRDARADATLDDYLRVERSVFDQMDRFHVPAAREPDVTTYCRYLAGGAGDPETFPHNWNRTTILEPEGPPVGGVLLLHGLSDSPYSMRHVGQVFRRLGHYVLCLRLPGHGTVPEALCHVRWEDWEAAAKLGAEHVARTVGPARPLYVGGYSTGGALALALAMDSITEGDGRCPDRLYLFSPSIGVTSFAMLSLVDQAFAWIPFFEKSAWLSINPEYDPFKYNSFPKRSGFEVWQLTRDNARRWSRLVQRGDVQRFPPVLAFQSAVDATVLNAAIRSFFEALPDNGSELVVFDVVNAPGIRQFLRSKPRELTDLVDTPTAFGVAVVASPDVESSAVVVRRRLLREAGIVETPLDRDWPSGVFSLAHVAIPFPPDDPIYGDGSGAEPGRLNLGAVRIRAERGVLKIPAEDLIRMRYNPFFEYVERRLEESLLPGRPGAAAETRPDATHP